MEFTKMHGCGNDYIFVNCFKEQLNFPSETAKKLSDRHFGIGSDGLVLIAPSEKSDFKMTMYNPDGTQAEMCGNAIRCVGKYVYEQGLTNKTEIKIETLAGQKTVYLTVVEEKVTEITVNMGIPIFSPKSIPVLSERNIVSKEEIVVNNKTYHMSCVSMGNPHAVIFVEDISKINVKEDGLALEFHSIFPNRTNVEFVQIVDECNILMRVWERGTGETLACGTGACAAASVGIMEDLLFSNVNVKLPGGVLKTKYDFFTGTVFLAGEVEKVFNGEI